MQREARWVFWGGGSCFFPSAELTSQKLKLCREGALPPPSANTRARTNTDTETHMHAASVFHHNIHYFNCSVNQYDAICLHLITLPLFKLNIYIVL